MSTSFYPNEERKEKGKLRKWQPRKWKVEYDRVVAMKVIGASNVEIAEKIGYTKEFISVILNLPDAQRRYDFFHDKYLQQQVEFIPTTLNYVAKKTVERLKEAVDDDELFKKNPFAVIDRGMDVLKGLRHLSGGGNGAIGNGEPGAHITNINSVVINASQKSDIMEGLDKLQEIKLLHGEK